MTVRGWCRTVRAGVFAAVCVLLAALGHVTMSGAPVPWWAMAAGATATGAAGWLLAGRERGRTSIVVVVTAAQALLHETFTQAQKLASAPEPTVVPGAGGSTGMSTMDMGSMDMGGMDMGSAAHSVHGLAGVGHLHDMHGMSGTASVGMFGAHLLAAVLCGLWLAHGERAVFRVFRAAAAWLAAPLRLLLAAMPAPLGRPSVRRRCDFDCPAPVRLLLCCSLTFRGPPAGAAVI
ncbi:hypothetical protein AB0465_00090 [Streptomyces griseoviridis]|uniref:hypothetical protein n=1 Tax=Streptomyces griseoviridis TaxID=45398 RepID=UPI00344DAE16